MAEREAMMTEAPAAAVRVPQRGEAMCLEAAPRTGETIAAYREILRRRRGTAVATGAVVAGLALVALVGMKPTYRAVARVELNAEAPQLQSVEGIYEQTPTNQEFLRTEMRVLETDQLAWRTVKQLGLGENASFLGKAPAKMRWRDATDRKMDLIRRFRAATRVELVPGSRVIEAGFEARDPQLAAQAANALVANFVEFNFEQQYEATRAVSERMGAQVNELKSAVEKSQRALADYERSHEMFNVSDKQNEVAQRLAELSSDFTAAQGARIQKESVYQQVQASAADAAALPDDAVLQQVAQRVAELKTEYAGMLAQYGPAYPKAVRAREQLREAEATLGSERARLLDRIRGEFEAAQKREGLLGNALAAQKQRASELGQVMVEHNLLRGEFESNQQLYRRLLQQLKDATVAAGLRATNIRVVDAALPPARPEHPDMALYLALCLAAGCLAGVMGAFVQEGLDTSVKTAEELEAATALPVLGVIPEKSSLQRRRWGLRRSAGGNGQISFEVAHAPAGALAESYREVRTALLLGSAACPPKSVLVTSATAGEGKTTTALNLAASLAQRGGPVVMVQADLSHADGLADMEIEQVPGLNEVLRGQQKWEPALQRVAEAPGLAVLAAGKVSRESADLICSEGMARLLEELGKKFRYVIVDSSPLLSFSDAAVLATMVDGVVLVVESGTTPRKLVRRTQKRLESAGARMLGAILNKFDAASDGSARYRAGGFPAWREEPPPVERARMN